MGFLRGPSSQATLYSGLQVATTSANSPIAIVWGENMITGTVMDYRGFRSKKVGSKSGGKGGSIGGVFGGGSRLTYNADILVGVCEGPISDIIAVYQTNFNPISLAAAGFALEIGLIGQAPVPYWTTKYPDHALAYSGLAYLAAPAFDLGPSATVGSMSLVVQGILYGTGFNGIDADPALVIEDFLTNSQYGVGFPASSIDVSSLLGASGSSSLQAYCQAAGLAFSPALIGREAANSIMTRWLQLLNCGAVWSGGKLKFIPYGDQALTANGWTWNPDLTIKAAFDDDSYYGDKGSSSDPVQVSRSDPYELENYLTLDIVARNNNYNSGPIPAEDQQARDRYGTRIKAAISAREVCSPAVAQVSAQLILQRGLYIRRNFSWKASWEFCWLDPMDLVSLTDPRIGLANTMVRIIAIEEDDSGLLTFTAEEFTVGVGTATAYPLQAPSNGAPDASVTPQPINTPILFEPPLDLTNGTVQIWAAVSPQGADPNWGGCIVNASFDGTSYSAIAQLNGVSTMGALTSSLAGYGGANPDLADTLSVSLLESEGVLISTTPANAAGGATALLVGDEYIGFETATLTGVSTYDCTRLYRGLFGSTIVSHAIGDPVALISSPMVKYTLPASAVGMALWFKFQSVNIFGSQTQSLASCTAYSYGSIGGLGTGAANYAVAWTQQTTGTPPVVGNGALVGAYAKNSAGTFITVNITLTIGSTTTITPDLVWQFSSPVPATATANGSFTATLGGSALIGSVQIASGASEIVMYGSAGPEAPSGTGSAGDQWSLTVTYPI